MASVSSRGFRRTGCQGGVAAMIIAHMRRNALRDAGKTYATVGKKAGAVIDWVEQLSHVMLKVTGYVMALAPRLR